MGDDCFAILMEGIGNMNQLIKLQLNIARNQLSVDGLMNNLIILAEMSSIETLEIDAKKNLKKVEDIESVKQILSATNAKIKRINL